jgi:hypothetical protein
VGFIPSNRVILLSPRQVAPPLSFLYTKSLHNYHHVTLKVAPQTFPHVATKPKRHFRSAATITARNQRGSYRQIEICVGPTSSDPRF